MREITELRLAQIGNLRATHSTENDLRDALRRLGVTPMAFQEDEPDDWEAVTKLLRAGDFDLVLWTSTEPFAARIGAQRQFFMLDAARRSGIPVIGYHLDRFIGLVNRAETIPDRPFFSVDMLYSADGGHQAEWEALGVKHTWMPPAISERWCKPGIPQARYECDIVFVGTWRNYHEHHRDWEMREELLQRVGKKYKNFKLLPARGNPRIVGLDLNDVYWSAKVVLGDSCLVPNPDGSPATHYCSDRVPETLGRGGILLHPFVQGVTHDVFPHLSWPLGNFADLNKQIDFVLSQPSEDWIEERMSSIEDIKSAHTYTHRMRAVLAEWGWGDAQ